MATEQYGRLDLWRDPAHMAEAEARDLADRLERRGRVPDERETRAGYLALLGIGPGQRVLDVGCGTGVATRDIASRVAPGGLTVGLDPNPALLGIAREIAAAEGLGPALEFRQGDARAIPFADDEFDVALAVTALTHVEDGGHAIPEMARVVRPGGRVAVFDLDTDSLIVTHPDRSVTRRIVAAHSDFAVVDGWLSRRLPGLFADAGLVDVGVRAFTPLERDPAGFYAGMAERAAEVAVQVGAIGEAERQRWLELLRAEQAAGRFLAGRTHLFVWGTRSSGATRPERRPA